MSNVVTPSAIREKILALLDEYATEGFKLKTEEIAVTYDPVTKTIHAEIPRHLIPTKVIQSA